MRWLAGALILLACASCGWLLYPYSAPVPRPRESEALAIARAAARPLLGAAVDRATLHVRWRTGTCPPDLLPAGADPTRTAVVWNRRCYSGLTFWGGETWIAWRGSFSSSAYAHELWHTWGSVAGHGDWILDGDAYTPGWCAPCAEAIAATNARLREAGL